MILIRLCPSKKKEIEYKGLSDVGLWYTIDS